MTEPTPSWPPDDPRASRVMLRRELVAEGYDDRAIARRLRDGTWVRVRRGAYVAAASWTALDGPGRHALRARAVLRQAKTDVVLSHVSGLPEYDAATWGLDWSDVHVTRADGMAGRAEAGVRQHCGLLLPGDVTVPNGVPVMNPTRLALEVSTVASAEASLVVVNDLLHRGLTTPRQLEARYASMDRWPRTLKTDLVLRLADGRLESAGETRAFYLFFRQGLPMPVLQHPVTDANGVVVARLDFAWPEHGVFLEFDGRIKYEKLLRSDERASDVVLREKRREELVCRLTGWRCVRLDWSDLERPERTAALVRAALSRPASAA